ncbi:hypothetical protein JKP88DRAFT_288936 [Tribonema minus]|uniref:Uncharacterized protein n=1 Tax=Tribonema minus TaxID=303371 RepID=A0A835Z2L8_9STRA|nr:hypothetical protein JKP88DRAFT_288936 [Tribonema minus]
MEVVLPAATGDTPAGPTGRATTPPAAAASWAATAAKPATTAPSLTAKSNLLREEARLLHGHDAAYFTPRGSYTAASSAFTQEQLDQQARAMFQAADQEQYFFVPPAVAAAGRKGGAAAGRLMAAAARLQGRQTVEGQPFVPPAAAAGADYTSL